MLSYFPELDAEITDPGSRSMLVRHIAAMASGHLEETIDRALGLDPIEPVRGFLLIPPDRQPGTVFAYNQPCTYALAAIVSLYVLWTFGRTDGTSGMQILMSVTVLGFPASIGAAAARLIL